VSDRVPIGVIRSRIDFKSWQARTPSVEAARPACCPRCGAASRPSGGRVCLHGHGLKARQLRGPPSPRGAPEVVVIQARRYRCQRCHGVVVVVPRETVPRRHYAATAIAFALALHGLCAQSQARVREQVSASTVVGVCAERRWCTLPRWIEAVRTRRLFDAVPVMPSALPRREVAARAAMAIGAHAPPSLQAGAPQERAFHGAAHMA
jgi:DNA-directed RNA polymerase subunit RPC12/RpoP